MSISLDTAQLRSWAREAGTIAKRYFQNVDPEWKGIADPVTAADKEIEQLLAERLAAAYPDHGIIGEEFGDRGQDAEYVWAIDPLDGTRGYVAGLPLWSITFALLHRQQPVFGLVYMPLIDDWTWTEGDDVLHNGVSIRHKLPATWDRSSFVLTRSDVNAFFDLSFSRVMALGSGANHFAYVARGAALATITYTTHSWDLAAGAAFLAKQGGSIRREDGSLLDFTKLDLMQSVEGLLIGGHPDVTARLLPLAQRRAAPRHHPAW